MAQEQETGNQRQRRNQSRRSQARLLHAPAYGFEEELSFVQQYHHQPSRDHQPVSGDQPLCRQPRADARVCFPSVLDGNRRRLFG
jgi:hypothetical protein